MNNYFGIGQNHNELMKAKILNAYGIETNDLEKGGKSYPIGTIHNGYKKVGEGKWKKVSEHGMTKAEHSYQAAVHENATKNDKERNSYAQKNGSYTSVNQHKKLQEKNEKISESLDDKDYSDEQVMHGERTEYGVSNKPSKDGTVMRPDPNGGFYRADAKTGRRIDEHIKKVSDEDKSKNK